MYKEMYYIAQELYMKVNKEVTRKAEFSSLYIPLNKPLPNNRTILKKSIFIIFQHVDPNRVTKYGWTAVEIAAINGHIDIVKMLVNQYNAKKNFENPNNGTTPLENAIEGGHLETVKYLKN